MFKHCLPMDFRYRTNQSATLFQYCHKLLQALCMYIVFMSSLKAEVDHSMQLVGITWERTVIILTMCCYLKGDHFICYKAVETQQ